MSEQFVVPLEGGELCGERRGDGLPLVLVHGMAGDRHEWDALWAELPDDLPLLRYDLRGFGLSVADGDMPYSHAGDLLSLLDAQSIAQAAVLGLSMGGGVALNFALSHPRRVTRLILISSAIVGWEWSLEWRDLWRAVASAARDGDMALARERWWMHPMFAATRECPAAGKFRKSIDAYHGRHWVRDNQRDELPDIERLHALSAPTLILTGERDFADIRLIADVIEAAAPDVRRIEFAGAGHMVHLERLREVAEAVAGFLGN